MVVVSLTVGASGTGAGSRAAFVAGGAAVAGDVFCHAAAAGSLALHEREACVVGVEVSGRARASWWGTAGCAVLPASRGGFEGVAGPSGVVVERGCVTALSGEDACTRQDTETSVADRATHPDNPSCN